ncbi:UNVERIFIED_CONTAM: AAA-ATPase [Sesamum latifolium]|uniref:AAA-ATPase n=1 Tax=Sesamum latifolium TaxID=2727402 RepID=A0AAW2T8U0_9LAMI
MFLVNLTLLFVTIILLCVVLRFLSKTSLIHSLKSTWRSLEDKCYVHQFYKVPKFNDNMQENQLYRKVYTYLNSLPCVEDSDFANLFSSSKSAEINLILDDNQTIVDKFLGARVHWRIENSEKKNGVKSLVLKIRKNDKRRILVPYLQHIHQVFDEIEQKRKEVRLFVNVENELQRNGRWISTSFTHPATMETIVMDSDLKTRIKSDLENFLKSRQYYHRLGRVWKRSYLLYGPAGTGKSTFIAAMAKFLSYDIYEINLHKVANDSDLKYLLLQTTNKSLIVIEDLDRYLGEKSTALSSSGILNFMDGIFSGCGEERVMLFTMNSKEKADPNILRPGRIDVHINFPLCDFTAFKSLANSHLGLKDHKLFPQVEEIFQTGASLSQAEICEIMISNRGSPSRALKTVITALQSDLAGRVRMRMSGFGSGRGVDESGEFGREGQNGIHPIKEIKNLYGLLRARSSRKPSMDKLDVVDVHEKENSHSTQES